MTWPQIQSFLWSSTIPGAAGGLLSFLLAFKLGRISKGKFRTKLVIEVVAGSLLATFMREPMIKIDQQPWCFMLGLCWSQVVQVVRGRVTEIGNEILKSKGKPSGGDDK